MYKRLEELIRNWIHENYGPGEAEDPCYNIEALAKYLVKNLTKEVVLPDYVEWCEQIAQDDFDNDHLDFGKEE